MLIFKEIKIGEYQSRIEEIEEYRIKTAKKVFDWDKWVENGTIQHNPEPINFDWKRWLRNMVNLNKSNPLRDILDDWGDEFDIWEWMLFVEHELPDYEEDECSEDCAKNNHLFWDSYTQFVWTKFIPELQIIAFDVWFEEHGYQQLYFPIWEMDQDYLNFDYNGVTLTRCLDCNKLEKPTYSQCVDCEKTEAQYNLNRFSTTCSEHNEPLPCKYCKTLQHFDNCPIFKKHNQCTCLLVECDSCKSKNLEIDDEEEIILYTCNSCFNYWEVERKL